MNNFISMILRAEFCVDEINKISSHLKNTNDIHKNLKIVNKKIFKCEFCDFNSNSGQALGGHMSRKHPNKSNNYSLKKMIRNQRETNRHIIHKARKELLSKYNYDYDELIHDKEKKIIFKNIRKDNKKEYQDIVDRLKKTYN